MIGPRGRDLLRDKEKCRLAAYPDSRGIPTIGWGHTRGVRLGDNCTQADADRWLDEDLAEAEAAVDSLVTVPLTVSARDALVVWAYNLGRGNLADSTLLKLLNRGDYRLAAREFPMWDSERKGGILVPNRGLLIRRFQEAALFAADPWPT